MIRPKNDTEDLLLSINKNCQTLKEQTYRKAEQTLELNFTKSSETFHFIPPMSIEGTWMIELTSLEVYNFSSNKNTTNFKLEFHTDTFDEFSFTEVKDEAEEILGISNFTSELLQDEIIGARIKNKKQERK